MRWVFTATPPCKFVHDGELPWFELRRLSYSNIVCVSPTELNTRPSKVHHQNYRAGIVGPRPTI